MEDRLMAAHVLFDAPGPKTVARHRTYSVVAVLVLLVLLGLAVKRLYDEGQFAYELWEPFVTPNIMQAIGEAWLDTLSMAALAVLGALVFGVVFGVAKLSEHTPVRWASWVVVEFFRAVPVIMLMTFSFYAVFNSMSIERGAYWSVVLSLTVYNGAVLAEVFRAGINALPRGQAEAAYAIGMRKTQVMNLILLPQAVKIMIPAIISQMVVALKDTSLILIVFGVGLTKILKSLPLSFNNIVPTTLVIAGLYVLTNLVLTAIANYAQKKFVGEKEMLQVSMVGQTDQNQSAATF
ncbi:amino acid ABC transporter permease [Nocardioides zhouii]|uniref:Amino acid ABC transporter permease n=2 Tax=Nocardioides zhouii TaxID=1168729 RepID=A0A4Q2SLJ7_9ACTN|nr:amino acid ABC transporter permease [Nocardioides zhouii]